MKKYIDYLFWKRTWFRFLFIMIPSWIIIIGYPLYQMKLVSLSDLEPDSFCRSVLVVLVILSWLLCINDNENVNNPPNPFK